MRIVPEVSIGRQHRVASGEVEEGKNTQLEIILSQITKGRHGIEEEDFTQGKLGDMHAEKFFSLISLAR